MMVTYAVITYRYIFKSVLEIKTFCGVSLALSLVNTPEVLVLVWSC